MAGITALTAVALGISAATGVSQASEAKRNRKKQEARLKKQEEEARAAAALENTRTETGADVELGAENLEADERRRIRAKATRSRTSPLGTVGGLGGAGALGLR